MGNNAVQLLQLTATSALVSGAVTRHGNMGKASFANSVIRHFALPSASSKGLSVSFETGCLVGRACLQEILGLAGRGQYNEQYDKRAI